MIAVKLSICFLLAHLIEGIIFNSPVNLDDTVPFQKSECFNTSGDLTNWLSKATSGQYYKRWVRPGVNETLPISPPLQVNISIDMNSMASVDELNSEYKIILKIDLEWIDERLTHNCSRKPVTVSLDSYLLDRIWSPKLGVPNIKDPDTSIIQGEATLILGQLRTDGYIHIRLSLLLNLFCYLNFELFPFDNQECYIKLESRSYLKNDLVLNWRSDHPFRNLESFQMTGFKLVGYELYNNSKISSLNMFDDIYGVEQMSQIMVKLTIQREWNNYFLEIYLPSILFVMISWLSFWMQITAAPARVSLGMTTMLTLVTSSRATRDKLPRISYIHALDVWIAFCTCFIFLSLIEFAFVSYLYRCSIKKKVEETRKTSEKRRKYPNIEPFCISNNHHKFLYSQNKLNIEHAGQLDTQGCPSELVELMSKLNKISVEIPTTLQSNQHQTRECQTGNSMQYPVIVQCPKRNHSLTSSKQGCFTNLFCCSFWCASDCKGEILADMIDRKCRILFPLCFVVFNIAYWCTYLL